MTERKPAMANISAEHLPVAFAMLYIALQTALTHIAEQASTDDWHQGLYERIQRALDDMNASAIAASQFINKDSPAFAQDMPGAIRAGSATVDAAFDAVFSEMRRRADGNPGT